LGERPLLFHGRNLVLQHQALTERIIGLAIEVHRKTGPGLLESVYAACLRFELEHAGIPLSRQVSIPVTYIRHVDSFGIPRRYPGG
jgi:PD-(D/E)XK nuclease superfamily